MGRCIYCLRSGEGVLFDREHVLPESFGGFKNNLVLSDGEVCAECNSHFGKTLDLALSRDSVEGLERYRWGVKAAKDVQHFRYGAVKLTATGGEDFDGAPLKLVPVPGKNELTAVPLPAGAVRKREGDGFQWFTPEEIRSGKWSEADVDWRRGIKLTGGDDDVAAMRTALESQGVSIKLWRPLVAPPPTEEVTVAQRFELTKEIARALAKISFNYAAKRFGAEFVLAPAFDKARAFIRHDQGEVANFVKPSAEMPFRTSRGDEFRPVIHFLAIGGDPSHFNVIGTVVLFGFLTYDVILGEEHHGDWPDLPVAHLYNVKMRTVSEHEPVRPRWRHP